MVEWTWVLLCIALSSAWCLSAGSELGATFDEPLYVARGLEAWRGGSHGGLLRLGTMPLPSEVQTLPLYAFERWRGAPIDVAGELGRVLPWARAATLVFWSLLLFYGWRSGRLAGGAWGGGLAVALLACEPALLAHAALATTDIPLAACLLALVYHFRAGRESTWPRRVAIPSLWFAASVLAKASGLVMGTLCLLAVEAGRGWNRRAGGRPAARALGDVGWIAGAGMVLVFLFCGSDWLAEPSFVAYAQSLPASSPVRAPLVWVAEHLRIFSNAGEGLVRQVRHNIRGHGAFLLGTAHPRAVWYYFPVLLTMKLSEPLLVALPLIALVRRRALARWPLLVAAVLLVASVTFRVQLGVRMALPIVVFAAVGVAAALGDAIAADRGTWRARLLVSCAGAALLWNIHTALALWPDGLVHVNRFWGGWSGGYRLVSDSNYDWGQGIPALRRWQREHGGGASLAVWYFGTDPDAQQPPLHVVPLHALPIRRADDVADLVRGQRLAVSTTLLYGSGLDGDAYRQAAAVLRQRRPIARTGTFLIYEFGEF